MIKIICVGKLKEKYLSDMVSDYKKRISKYHNVEIIELKDSNIDEEKTRIEASIKNNEYVICMCIEGKQVSSIEFKDIINNQLIYSNPNITFVIGGSDGIHKDIVDNCDLKLSFSKLTFPHGLFRAILLEQIYRSFKIINNEKYHK